MSKSNKKKQKNSSNVSQVKEQNIQSETENVETVEVAKETEVRENEVQIKQDETNKKVEKNNTKNKKQNQKKINGKVVEKKTFGQKCRALCSELKKVTWPTFKEASKQTGVVLLLVLLFGAVLLGINLLLGWLFGLIVG